ncbi:sugar-binding transcriptional regulator [Caproiciproducens sp.]|uniref:sugar-binding transcriptional regulator n=1 Tax=Caproiciproducens sp. TaxID=1954376 RepID=UPI0028A27875|nr:sugar-binding domain-containing protein [Caproiciproducens sp.]
MKSEVYNQSVCIMDSAAYMYYIEKRTLTEISQDLSISKPTVSRLLKRAVDEGVVEFKISKPFADCIELEKKIMNRYGLKSVIVVPVLEPEKLLNAEETKKRVALEGARYLQRIVTDDDILGLSWGGTMYHLIQYLNPCRKVNAKVLTMHGSIADCDEKLAVNNLVRRAAMAFGGKNVSICANGLADSTEHYRQIKDDVKFQKVFSLLKYINISVSGVGVFFPNVDSLLASSGYLKAHEMKELIEQKVCCDFALRFINMDGQECESSLKDRTLSICLDTYKKIPCKIVVASGSKKAYAVRALLKGNLVDVLIIDYYLANALYAL